MTRHLPPFVMLALVVAAALAGCGRSERQRLEEARRQIDQRNPDAATVELKSLLQQAPGSAPARFLLGRSLFMSGDALGAEAELRRALDAGHPPQEVAPVLAAVMVALQRFAPLLKEFGSLDPGDATAAADLKTQLAVAMMATGALDEARRTLDAALQRVPDHRQAQEVKARLLAARGEGPAALAIAEGLLQRQAGDAAAWALKADVLVQSGAAGEAAIQAYRQALTLEPKLVQAHSGLLDLYLGQRRFDAATQQWQELKAVQPGHPQTQFYEALLALQRGEAHRVREIAQWLIRAAPDNPRLHMLAGLAESLAGSIIQAETHLTKAQLLAPGMPQPRRMLAQAYLHAGQPRKALDTLVTLIGPRSEDLHALTQAGQAHLMLGDLSAAETVFARAERLSPTDPQLRTGVAIAQLQRGQGDAGLAALEAVAQADPSTTADLAVVNARLQRRQPAQALAALDRLAGKMPGSPLPDLLRGRVALSAMGSKPDRAAARTAFESALQRSPAYLPALQALAELDLAESQPQAARERIAAASQREPHNAALLVALADITGRSGGGKKDVVTLLQQAVRASGTDAQVRLQLIDYLMALGDHTLALAEAQSAITVLPEHPALLDRLGLAQQHQGDLQQAVSTFIKLASLQPGAAAPHLRLVEANLALGRHEVALEHARRATELEPTAFPGYRLAAMAALRGGNAREALAFARAAQRRWPLPGLQLEGEVELAQRRPDEAIALFRRLLAEAPGTEAARALHVALLAGQRAAEAERHAQAWIDAHPKDSPFVMHLGLMAVSQGDARAAAARFAQILKREPNHVEALNNLAHVLALQKDPAAIGHAERALRLAPNRPPLMDTLAFARAALGQTQAALQLQTQVVELAPDVPEFRLQLARLQLAGGDKVAAAEHLNRLAKLGPRFAQQAEVSRLQQQARP